MVSIEHGRMTLWRESKSLSLKGKMRPSDGVFSMSTWPGDSHQLCNQTVI